MRGLQFDALLTESGWLEPGYVTVDDGGNVVEVSRSAPRDMKIERVAGWLLPGFQNGHSHAFQYAMAGMAERLAPGAGRDDFWSWRETMYQLALSLSPDDVEAIAAMLYAEMLRHGYTQVTEFHYLHRDIDGRDYASPAEMGERLMVAAERVGIRLTLVPVFYHRGTFGQPPTERQRRFLSRDLDHYWQLVEATMAAAKRHPTVTVGQGLHSLRAATEADAAAVLTKRVAPGPIHVHIAEQKKEVADAEAAWGQRPVAWLLDHVELSPAHSLVHATHMTGDETARLAATGATVVICPSTEGNLGDGFFPLARYRAARGRWAIGTDSHVGLSPLEELRWLDYGQRLLELRRNVLCMAGGDSSGEKAFGEALAGGRLAGGDVATAPYHRKGAPLDGVVIDADHPALCAKPLSERLSAIIYAGDPTCIKGTLRQGRWVISDQRHAQTEALRRAFQATLTKLALK